MMRDQEVFLIWRPWLGPFQIALATELKRRGARLHLYVGREGDAEVVLTRGPPDLFVRHSAYSLIYDAATSPAGELESEIRRAKAHEDWMGAPYGHIVIGDRHLGRGFALGGGNFPTSTPSRASRAQMLAAVSAQIEYWRREFEQHRPAFMIDGDRIQELVGARSGVAFRLLAGSRQGNLYYWAHNSFFESPEIASAYTELERAGFKATAEAEIEQATPTVIYWRTAMDSAKLSHFLRQSCYQVGRRAWYRLRRRDPNNFYDIGSTVGYLWRMHRNSRRMTGASMVPLASLTGKPFVYLALSTEPESTLQGLSPEYFFQLETVAAIARDLPADVVLAVKEHHPACGARDDGFYDKILAFKNVVMLDMRERGPDVIRQAAVTVTISGSSGFEAAAIGKPTIILGRHNIYDFLPHVRLVKDIAEIGTALKEALSVGRSEHSARRDGAKFLEAMKRISFDLEAYDPFTPGAAVSDRSATVAVEALERSLSRSPERSPARVLAHSLE